jgi:HD-like signal output (HDOD) protein
MLSLDQLLEESERIEPVPQVVHQLMDLVEDPEVPISEITDLIVYEPVVTANLLKLANSAAFGFKKKWTPFMTPWFCWDSNGWLKSYCSTA